MAHRTPAPLRAVGALVRALLGLALLAALLAGTPYALLLVGTQPTDLSGGMDVLLRPDDGTLFFTVLTCIGWLAWAAFTLSVLLEIVAVARRRSAPRLRGLGGLQSFASVLIGGIVLLAPTAASAATSAPAVAATASHTAGDHHSDTSTTPATAGTQASATTHTVTSSTELPWDLAEKYLGSGERWQDIAALNNIPELTAGDQYLPKGAVINLPADARPVAPATTTSNSPQANEPAHQSLGQQPSQEHAPDKQSADATETDRPDSVTVHEGDNLWDIADAQGDPENWHAIYEANRGEPTPDGGHFTNPNLIFPGQKLDLPQADTAGEPPADQDTAAPSTPQKPAGKQGEKKPAPDHTADQEADADEPAAPPAASHTQQPAPSKTAPSPTPEPAAPATSDTALAPAAVWAGAGALAAALVGTLTTRRILQQRRRRPGRRIPMPQGRAAATEQGLRAAQHPTGFDLLDTTLRTLALNLAAARRKLPVLEAVVLHETKVELHLAEGAAPMTPFSATAGRTDLWICSASSPDLADEEQLQDADAPYPALVSIGWDGAGHLVLVDLEHVGILNLAGEPDFARQVLRAISVELASTPLPGHLEVTTLADTAPGLDTAAPERVVRIDAITDATAELTSHTGDQRRALAAIGATSLSAARLMDDAAGAWTPHILLAETLADADEAQATLLFDTLTEEPRTAGAVITASAATGLRDTAWTLECRGPDHTISLPGSNLPIKLQGLSDEHFADAIELLTLAASDADVPAPDWARAGTDDQDDQLPWEEPASLDDASLGGAELETVAVEGTTDGDEADDEGLPAEYAADELDLAGEADGPVLGVDAEDELAPAPVADLAKPEAPDEPAADNPTVSDTTGNEHTTSVGPANATLALSSPCTEQSAPTLSVTIPAPAAETAPDAHQTTAAAVEPPEPTVEAAEAPAVSLLGPISIEGANGRIDSNRRTAATELIAFLALNPGVDHHAVDDALWPGRLVNKQMRNAVISRTRSWLGKNAEGQAHLPRVQDTGDSRYRLGPDVTCDWSRFQRFARTGLARHNEDGDLALRRALSLVRGRPFTGIDTQRYAWAEPFIQEMVSAIVDVAYELSSRRRETDDVPGALWAARRGLLAAEESEMLHRQLFLAHHAAGDIQALREAAARLARINEQLLGGVDMEAETAELLRNLLPRPVMRAR
ncbi:LysM peptidoglycan-binding domain-containing protein [Streptomyces sp. NPDC017964]|uniref:LysM peptidoglycan-binding domain-containing protein n=1 Tax=Streptomyces sp. NPDC017964 TaxID=3365022 RepID=UPI0037A70D6D